MSYISEKLALPGPASDATGPSFRRADLQFHGVYHGGESYEGRIYLNNPDADLRTPRNRDAGYAGSIYIFGHPHCWGDRGHCVVPPGPLHGYDDRSPHHLIPQLHTVEITEAITDLARKNVRSVAVTVLPVLRRGKRRRIDHSQLRFDLLRLVTYE
ncbi:MAG: hypothetical protein ACRD3Q_13790 [Terriglobales bacterium]